MIDQNKYKWIENIEKTTLAYAYLELETKYDAIKEELESVKAQLKEALEKAYDIHLESKKIHEDPKKIPEASGRQEPPVRPSPQSASRSVQAPLPQGRIPAMPPVSVKMPPRANVPPLKDIEEI